MTGSEAATAIKRVINGEIDDCERAIKANGLKKAQDELDYAVIKLRRIATALEQST